MGYVNVIMGHYDLKYTKGVLHFDLSDLDRRYGNFSKSGKMDFAEWEKRVDRRFLAGDKDGANALIITAKHRRAREPGETRREFDWHASSDNMRRRISGRGYPGYGRQPFRGDGPPAKRQRSGYEGRQGGQARGSGGSVQSQSGFAPRGQAPRQRDERSGRGSQRSDRRRPPQAPRRPSGPSTTVDAEGPPPSGSNAPAVARPPAPPLNADYLAQLSSMMLMGAFQLTDEQKADFRKALEPALKK